MAPRKLDMRAIAMLAKNHPGELKRLREQLEAQERGEAGEYLDRYGRRVDVGSKVVTRAHELGRIVRIDGNSKRALVKLEGSDGRTRMLRVSGLELRRGRPRRDSYARAS